MQRRTSPPFTAITLMLFFAGAFVSAAGAARAEQLYSIQVRAVPIEEKADGLSTYRGVREKGYLGYHYTAEVDGLRWLRVAVGVFASRAEAVAFGQTFSAREGLPHFVTPAPACVTATVAGDFVVTPSALWTRRQGENREAFLFDDPALKGFAAPDGIRLAPSPDGRAVAFQYDGRVYAVGIDGAVSLLAQNTEGGDPAGGPGFGADPVYGPVPRWSPSGRYVAFLDYREFEVTTSLWLARADGSMLRTLVDYRAPGDDRAVKGFVWHPEEDRIFFVDGYAYGTVNIGGVIRSVDMDGNAITVLESGGERSELAGPLRIEEGYLHYRIVRFDEQYIEKSFEDARIGVAKL